MMMGMCGEKEIDSRRKSRIVNVAYRIRPVAGLGRKDLHRSNLTYWLVEKVVGEPDEDFETGIGLLQCMMGVVDIRMDYRPREQHVVEEKGRLGHRC